MALLSYRATPCGLTPAELLMERRIKTDVPQMKKVFIPDWPISKNSRRQMFGNKKRIMTGDIKLILYHLYRTIYLFGLTLQEKKDHWTGKYSSVLYHVEVPSGEVRRTISHLRPRVSDPTDMDVSGDSPKVICHSLPNWN